MKRSKPNVKLKKTLRELEKSLAEWDNIRIDHPPLVVRRKESAVAMKTHLLLLALKDQIDELS